MSKKVNIYYDNVKDRIFIQFDTSPPISIREGLKKCGFKYNWDDNLWIGSSNLQTKEFIKSILISYYNRRNTGVFIKEKNKLNSNINALTSEPIKLFSTEDKGKKTNNNTITISKYSNGNKDLAIKKSCINNEMVAGRCNKTNRSKSNGVSKDKAVSKNKVIKSVDKENISMEITKYEVGVQVRHEIFGIGKIISNNKKVIEVMFHNGEIIKFNLDFCLYDSILEVIDLKNNFDDLISMEFDDLMKLSDELYNRKDLGIKYNKVNKIIIQKGCKDVKYHIRLAEYYKLKNMLEEAIEICALILKIDKNNKYARDNLSLYGKNIHYKYKEKVFDGTHRDVYSLPAEEMLKWYLEEQEKTNTKFFNSIR